MGGSMRKLRRAANVMRAGDVDAMHDANAALVNAIDMRIAKAVGELAVDVERRALRLEVACGVLVLWAVLATAAAVWP